MFYDAWEDFNDIPSYVTEEYAEELFGVYIEEANYEES